jgi:hypothetical protein
MFLPFKRVRLCRNNAGARPMAHEKKLKKKFYSAGIIAHVSVKPETVSQRRRYRLSVRTSHYRLGTFIGRELRQISRRSVLALVVAGFLVTPTWCA